MNPPQHNQDDGTERVPGLECALRKIHGDQKLFIPPAVDQVILREAGKHFATAKVSARGTRPFWSSWRLAFAGAVTMFVGGALFLLLTPPRIGNSFQDINHDGRVDILDALALSRLIQAGPSPDSKLDQNGDGKIDENDVNAVAMAAVRLYPKPRS